LLASALTSSGVSATHVDAREFIVTDDQYGSAAPLCWETYARLRRRIPQLSANSVVVMADLLERPSAETRPLLVAAAQIFPPPW
jgi:hypothetical protein